ncbi:hypothetical protein MRX96_026961 [Rhipicephalus microplus]
MKASRRRCGFSQLRRQRRASEEEEQARSLCEREELFSESVTFDAVGRCCLAAVSLFNGALMSVTAAERRVDSSLAAGPTAALSHCRRLALLPSHLPSV